MTDLAPHKARIDNARDLPHLAKIAADIEAKMTVEHWPTEARVEFDQYRFNRAIELAQKIRMAG